MSKKSKVTQTELRREDPTENNWEIEDEQGTRSKEQVPELAVGFKKQWPDELTEVFKGITEVSLKEMVHDAWVKVDPEIRTGNPVWRLGIQNGCTIFVFRSGQKVRVYD